jgi:hypothetical protein
MIFLRYDWIRGIFERCEMHGIELRVIERFNENWKRKETEKRKRD